MYRLRFHNYAFHLEIDRFHVVVRRSAKATLASLLFAEYIRILPFPYFRERAARYLFLISLAKVRARASVKRNLQELARKRK